MEHNHNIDPAHIIGALQEEIVRLRGALSQAEDNRIYLSAMLMQSQAVEASMTAELDQLREQVKAP